MKADTVFPLEWVHFSTCWRQPACARAIEGYFRDCHLPVSNSTHWFLFDVHIHVVAKIKNGLGQNYTGYIYPAYDLRLIMKNV